MRTRQHCARCQAPASQRVAESHPRLTIDRCTRCGYFNVTAAQPQQLPLPASLHAAGADALRLRLLSLRQTDAGEGSALFGAVAESLAGAALDMIDDAPGLARSVTARALDLAETELARHDGRPRGNDLARTASARAAALLFALTTRQDGVDFDAPVRAAVSPSERRLHEHFWPVATDASAIGSILQQYRRGDLRIHVEAGHFSTVETEQGLDIAEYLINRRAQPGPGDFEQWQVRALREALALAFGVDLRHLLRYAVDEQGQRRTGLVMVRKDAVPDAVRVTLDAFEFTTERVRTREEPWFHTLQPPAVRALDERQLALSLLSRNWTAYTPVFSGRHDGQAVYVLGPQAVAITLENLMYSKNRILQQLTEAAPQGLPRAVTDRLRALRGEMNRHAENRARTELESLGWNVIVAGDWHAAGKREEIDIMALRASEPCVDLLVGEVKDFDHTLHRARGPLGAAQRLRAGDAQLARKLNLVLGDLPSVLTRFGCVPGRRNVQVHALLITNDAPPRDLLERFDGADTGALTEFTRLLDTDRALAMRIFGRASRTLAT